MEEPIRSRVTLAEYLELPEDGKRYEVLEGTLMMSPAPGFRHQRASTHLLYAFDTWRRASDPEGQALAAPFDVVLADDTIMQPDLIYVSSARIGLIRDERLHGAPDVAVEIFRTEGASRDRVAKLQLYARFGVAEYWLVDLDAREIRVLGLASGACTVTSSGTGTTAVRSARMAGLAVVPADIFAGI